MHTKVLELTTEQTKVVIGGTTSDNIEVDNTSYFVGFVGTVAIGAMTFFFISDMLTEIIFPFNSINRNN